MYKVLIYSSLLLVVVQYGCSSLRSTYTYEVCIRTEAKPSLLIKDSLIGLADTTTNFLSGYVSSGASNEAAPFVRVLMINKQSNLKYGAISDENGYYEIVIATGTYQMEVSSIGYSNYQSDSIYFGTGQIRRIDFNMGEESGFKMVEIKSKNKLSDEELQNIAKDI